MHEQVVESRWRDADQTVDDGRRVDQRESTANLLNVEDQLHLMARRNVESDRLSLADLLALGHPSNGMAGRFDTRLEHVEIALMFHPKGKSVDPNPGVVADGETVVVSFVETL